MNGGTVKNFFMNYGLYILLFVLAVVALGLSIGAFTKKCNDDDDNETGDASLEATCISYGHACTAKIDWTTSMEMGYGWQGEANCCPTPAGATTFPVSCGGWYGGLPKKGVSMIGTCGGYSELADAN